jgi:type III pantothenate kinase
MSMVNSKNHLNMLVLDQGNTFLKCALFQQDKILASNRFHSLDRDELINYLQSLENKFNLKISHSILSSVIPVNDEFKRVLENKTIFTQLNPETPLPIINKYKTPLTLGNDRKAAIVAAIAMFPGKDLLVIDAGTCVTFDFINRQNEYLGGAISPGIILRFKALHTFTGNLPLINPEVETKLIGDSTQSSILSGVINGIRAEMDGIINQYKSLFPKVKVIFTGGDIKYFDKYLKNNIFAVENLVLVGLKDILLYNV